VRLSSLVPRLAVNLRQSTFLTTFTPKAPPITKTSSEANFYFLLSDGTATSQQLRITRNNFRLSACDECCVLLLAVLSTACSAAAHGRNAGVVGEEKEKK
jgi:hypothetical protein